jgi:tRNA(Arg) A34 adenosine deaminase TadA
VNDDDRRHLERCVDLAAAAVDAGDEPFGSLLVTADGAVRREDRNRVNSGNDATRHPEFELARWAATNLTPEERRTATVYTSGEHCPMCSAAHAWVGLGRIVFASSGAQTAAWAREAGLAASPINALSIHDVAPGIETDGPAPELEQRVKALHQRAVQPPSTTIV